MDMVEVWGKNLRKSEERGTTLVHRMREVKESAVFTLLLRSMS